MTPAQETEFFVLCSFNYRYGEQKIEVQQWRMKETLKLMMALDFGAAGFAFA